MIIIIRDREKEKNNLMNHSTKKMTIKYLQQRDIRIICIYI